MISGKILLGLLLGACTTVLACGGTALAGSVSACSDPGCVSCLPDQVVFVKEYLDTSEFNGCTALSAPVLSVFMQRPRTYFTNANGRITPGYYGNVTRLMYTTDNCAGEHQLITIPDMDNDPQEGCGAPTGAPWLSLNCEFGGCPAVIPPQA